MARHFSNFLAAYHEYASDGFCPDKFHRWVGISILAAAIERKISLKQGRIHHVPNLYVMLVSHPAVGKSTAMDAGTDLLERMRNEYNPNFRIIPNQTNEPAFIDLMKVVERFQISDTKSLPQSAGFFYASEASSSALQNTCGDFVATLTAFYDCPRWFRKKLKSDQYPVEIENGCMNILAGSTFNYLKTLVNEQSVLGGFASRLLYIVHEDRKVREMKWGSSHDLDSKMAAKLVSDLAHINTLVGGMKPTPCFTERWEAWQPKFDQYLIDLKSERLEAIMSRKGTNLIKLSMLLSISEGDSLVVTGDHFDRALAEIEDVYSDNPKIIAFAAMADLTTQRGMTQYIAQTLKRGGGNMSKDDLMSSVLTHGNDLDRVEKTYEAMVQAKWIDIDSSSGKPNYKLLIDPNKNL